jgi:ABC-type nitrate/sulfonate/bicarbonate transport system substrate-binding protein
MTSAALAAGSACGRRKPAALPRKLRVGAARRLSMSSLHLANELGFFRKAGFDLEIFQTGGASQAMALLAGSKIDVLFGSSSTACLNAVIKGLPLRIVAGREVASPTCGNVGGIYGMHRTFPHGLADVAQLKGKRVATGPMIGLAQFALDAHLAGVGLSTKDVTTVSLDFRQSVAALLGGGVDAIVFAEELERDLASMAAEIVHTPGLAHVYPNFQFSYIFFGESMLAADPDFGARFLSAYLQGAREFARGRTPRFMEEFARSNRLDVKRVVMACRNTFTSDGTIDLDSLRLFSEWAVRRKYVSRPVDTSELVDIRFLSMLHES